jgi:hypothetical protein
MCARSARVGLSLAALLGLLCISSVAPVQAVGPASRLFSILSGAHVVPGPGDPDGIGSITIDRGSTSGTLCSSLAVADVGTVTGANVYHGAPGAGGPVVVPLGISTSTACVSGVDPSLLSDLFTNPADYFVEVTTADLPLGALRGQLGVAGNTCLLLATTGPSWSRTVELFYLVTGFAVSGTGFFPGGPVTLTFTKVAAAPVTRTVEISSAQGGFNVFFAVPGIEPGQLKSPFGATDEGVWLLTAASATQHCAGSVRIMVEYGGLIAILTGDQVIPAGGDPDGIGTVGFGQPSDNTIAFEGIGGTSKVAVFRGTPTVTGPLVTTLAGTLLPLPPDGAYGSGTCCSPGDFPDLYRNPQNYYVVMQTPSFPGGAIRGQLQVGPPACRISAKSARFPKPTNTTLTVRANEAFTLLGSGFIPHEDPKVRFWHAPAYGAPLFSLHLTFDRFGQSAVRVYFPAGTEGLWQLRGTAAPAVGCYRDMFVKVLAATLGSTPPTGAMAIGGVSAATGIPNTAVAAQAVAPGPTEPALVTFGVLILSCASLGLMLVTAGRRRS